MIGMAGALRASASIAASFPFLADIVAKVEN
jgi:hypothetical protein